MYGCRERKQARREQNGGSGASAQASFGVHHATKRQRDMKDQIVQHLRTYRQHMTVRLNKLSEHMSATQERLRHVEAGLLPVVVGESEPPQPRPEGNTQTQATALQPVNVKPEPGLTTGRVLGKRSRLLHSRRERMKLRRLESARERLTVVLHNKPRKALPLLHDIDLTAMEQSTAHLRAFPLQAAPQCADHEELKSTGSATNSALTNNALTTTHTAQSTSVALAAPAAGAKVTLGTTEVNARGSLLSNECQMREALVLSLLKPNKSSQVYVQKDQCAWCGEDLRINLAEAVAHCPRVGCGFTCTYAHAAEDTAQLKCKQQLSANTNEAGGASSLGGNTEGLTVVVATQRGSKRTLAASSTEKLAAVHPTAQWPVVPMSQPTLNPEEETGEGTEPLSKKARVEPADFLSVSTAGAGTDEGQSLSLTRKQLLHQKKSRRGPQYRKFLWQFCDKVPDPPDFVLDALAQELQKVHFFSHDKGKTTAVTTILTERGLSQYAPMALRLVYILTGAPVPVLSEALIERLDKRFAEFHCNQSGSASELRKKGSHYSSITHMLLRLEDEEQLARCFAHHRTRAVIASEDQVLSQFCRERGGAEAGWKFVRSC